MAFHTIILAGGEGRRLWPLSTKNRPKPCLSLKNHQSLLEQTISRLTPLKPDSISIATQKPFYEIVQAQTDHFTPQPTLFVEPARKNTAGAIVWSLTSLLDTKKAALNDICVVSPADLYFSDDHLFLTAVTKGVKAASQKKIVTLGITPDRAEKEYGYIEIDPTPMGVFFKVTRFIEKPPQEKAKMLTQNPHFFWNSGMFIFEIGTFLGELSAYAPPFFSWAHKPYLNRKKTFKDLPCISIDHLLMEKSKNLALIPYRAKWGDRGSWERIYRDSVKDCNGNALQGNIAIKETKNSLIYGGDRKKIVTLGVDNMVIVQTEQITFIASRDHLPQLEEMIGQLELL